MSEEEQRASNEGEIPIIYFDNQRQSSSGVPHVGDDTRVPIPGDRQGQFAGAGDEICEDEFEDFDDADARAERLGFKPQKEVFYNK